MFKDVQLGDEFLTKANGGRAAKVVDIKTDDDQSYYNDIDGLPVKERFLLDGGGWYSSRTGWYLDATDKSCFVSLVKRVGGKKKAGTKMFHPIVKAEAETLELNNLFDSEDLAKDFADKLGYTYIGKGTEVVVPKGV